MRAHDQPCLTKIIANALQLLAQPFDRTAPANGDTGSDRASIRIDGRVRRSRGSDERQTAQSQPIAGTPWDVPLPRTVTRIMADG